MRDLAWFAALLALPLLSLWCWRIRWVSTLDLPARLSIALMFGAITVTSILFFESILGIPWTRVSVGAPMLLLAVLGKRGAGQKDADPWWHWLPVLIVVGITAYGVSTARETCADLLLFWGPKAQHFHYAGTIDAAFLRDPAHQLMHPDYPPLLPLLYVWGSLAARAFSWWGALECTPLFLLAAVAAFRGIARKHLDAVTASLFAFLLAAVLGLAFAVGMVAGAGDVPLIFFETIALAALTFGSDDSGARWVAAVSLGAASFLKVEGCAFAAVVIGIDLLLQRKPFRSLLLAIPSIGLLGSWILYARSHGLLEAYLPGRQPIHLAALPEVLYGMVWQAAYRYAYLPWIAALAPMAFARNWRRALLPLLTAAGSIASTGFFYLHEANPKWWIASSAPRVLLTPLMALVVASAAMSTKLDFFAPTE